MESKFESYREYGGIDSNLTTSVRAEIDVFPVSESNKDKEEIIEKLRTEIVGEMSSFGGPFGSKPIVYCDWTASGRCLTSVEYYLQSEVLPLYGNTHTTTSITGHQSTCFRDEARKIVAQCVNAKITGRASEDLVLFTGNGTTGAVAKLILALGLHLPLPEDATEDDRPIVLVSAYEHHSNLLSWRETVADVETISYDDTTGVCLRDLQDKLQRYGSRRLIIGAFSAASNVTGLLTDVTQIAILVHKAGGLVFFDYATAAPYTAIDMNPTLPALGEDAIYAYKDAIYFSGHKFLGGPGTPGVLIVKSKLMPPQNTLPTEPGGGTVFYVTNTHHRYLSNKVEREEAGTPNLLGDVKLGLVLHLHSTIGTHWIEAQEHLLSTQVEARFRAMHPRVVLLGRHSSNSRHLPIFSFLIRFGSRFLHFNFVCALLNDLFGIQSRGGCSCAGPLSQQILGISDKTNREIELALLDKHEVLRPGYTRMSFPYWMTQAAIDYVLNGVEFIALHGWTFLPQYKYNPKTGEWAHLSRMTKFPERKWLTSFAVGFTVPSPSVFPSVAPSFEEVLREVEAELKRAQGSKELLYRLQLEELVAGGQETIEKLRWFTLLEDVNKTSAQALSELQTPFNPSDRDRRDGEQFEEAGINAGSAYAQKRSAGKLAARSSSDNSAAAAPRYMTSNWKAAVPSSTTPGKFPLAKAEESLSSESIDAKPASAAVCMTREKPIDGKLLPGQGVTFSSASDVKIAAKPVDPPKKLMKLVGQAVKEWDMIQDGDKLLLGLSGGKDSLALLHILIALQRRAPVRFEIACCTVDPQTASYDPSSLIPYIKSLGITYHYMSEPIIELAKSKMQGDSLCAFCARFKRGLLYSTCRTHGYNKLVLAQHLDDLAESFYMSLNHNGVLRTMKANYAINAGDVRVIRPLVYCREKMTRDFAKASRLPVVNENCPACFEEPKERARVKKILMQEEAMVPALFFNLRKALLPLMHEKTYEVIKQVEADVEQNGSSVAVVKRTRASAIAKSEDAEAVDVEADGGHDTKKAKMEPNAVETILKEAMASTATCTDDYCVPCYELM